MSEQDIASLGLKVDSSQVKEADKSLNDLAKSANKAEIAAKSLGDTTEHAAGTFDKSAKTIFNAAAHIAEVDPRVRIASHALEHLGLSITTILGGGALVGGLLAVASAFVQGSHEAEKFAIAIALTGNAAGVTVDQLNRMAEQLAETGSTQGNAAKALTALASTGAIAADNLREFAAVAIELEDKAGVPIEETAKRLAALADEPTKASAALQKSFSFLTPAIYDVIRAQEKSGDVAAAAATAQKAYVDAVAKGLQAVTDNTPLIVSAWHSIERAAGSAWDAMAGAGRTQSPEQTIEQLRKNIEFFQKGITNSSSADAKQFAKQGIDSNQAEIDRLQKIIDANNKNAAAIAASKKRTDEYIVAQDKATAAAEKYADAWKRINAAWDAFDQSKLDNELAIVTAKFDAAGEILDAQHAANLVSDEKFYAKRRDLLTRETDAEIAELRKKNAVLAKLFDNFTPEGVAAQSKAAENNARIQQLRIKLGGELHVVDIQEADDAKKKADALDTARDAADKYTASLIRQYQIEVQGLGLGEKERQRLRDIQEIEQKFLDRQGELAADKRRGDITEAQYRQYLKIEQDALDRSLKAYDEYYKALLEKQGSWLVGVHEGLANWLDSARNVADQVADLIEKSMDRGIDAIVEFARTGKLNFGKLVEDILADLLRIELRVLASQALQQIFGALGGAAGGVSTTPSNTPGDPGFQGPVHARAAGGQVNAGQPYVIGENGPELMIPATSGYVMPSGSWGPQINIVSNIAVPQGVTPEQLNAILDMRDAKVKYDITENMLRNRGAWRGR